MQDTYVVRWYLSNSRVQLGNAHGISEFSRAKLRSATLEVSCSHVFRYISESMEILYRVVEGVFGNGKLDNHMEDQYQ